ncbi:MAG TPA: hypothetical protein VFR41_02040 [Acidimicrobiia bacterium]|nr:hypothetical protein [Acidimicrobiia bacterium]
MSPPPEVPQATDRFGWRAIAAAGAALLLWTACGRSASDATKFCDEVRADRAVFSHDMEADAHAAAETFDALLRVAPDEIHDDVAVVTRTLHAAAENPDDAMGFYSRPAFGTANAHLVEYVNKRCKIAVP